MQVKPGFHLARAGFVPHCNMGPARVAEPLAFGLSQSRSDASGPRLPREIDKHLPERACVFDWLWKV